MTHSPCGLTQSSQENLMDAQGSPQVFVASVLQSDP